MVFKMTKELENLVKDILYAILTATIGGVIVGVLAMMSLSAQIQRTQERLEHKMDSICTKRNDST